MPRDRLLIQEMVDAATRAIDLVGDLTAEQLRSDRKSLDALSWNYMVLGEAASQVSDETKKLYQHVDWAEPVRLRNRIVHSYWKIDPRILRATANNDLPGYIESLQSVLAVIEDPPPDD